MFILVAVIFVVILLICACCEGDTVVHHVYHASSDDGYGCGCLILMILGFLIIFIDEIIAFFTFLFIVIAWGALAAGIIYLLYKFHKEIWRFFVWITMMISLGVKKLCKTNKEEK